MKDLTVIIPVHEINEQTKPLLCKAVESIKNDGPLFIIGPKETLSKVKVFDELKETQITYINNEKAEIPSQINEAVKNVKTKFFTVLEFDDYFTSHYFENVKKYHEFYPNVDALMPLNEAVDFQNSEEGPVGYINEVFWASSFSNELGYLDEESVREFFGLNFTGTAFKKDVFVEVGGLKESMKMGFWQEFILRFLHNGKSVFVMPKVGYVHYLNRPNSLSEQYRKNISKEEAEWWAALSQQEYYYKTDRKKTYTK